MPKRILLIKVTKTGETIFPLTICTKYNPNRNNITSQISA